MRKIQLFFKRAFDLFVSIILLLLLIAIPVMIVIPIAIRLTSKGPAVFTQERIGKDGKAFKIYKFRTMKIPSESYDENGNQLEPRQRITKVGAFLRKTSLDELMQIFNIINGTMSFVGPRPTIPAQVEAYTDYHKQRHKMRPGITGWAQVNGRNDLKWSKKIEYDIEYINKFSIWMDIKIMFKTVGQVIRPKGIEYHDGDAVLTTEKAAEETTVVDDKNGAK